MIVLASDNAEVVARISTLLKQKGDLFTVAGDEPEAFTVIRAERATMLIVDTTSSAFNGFALCGAVRSDPDLSSLPVLCIVDLQDLSSILSVLDCEADGFLTPPFDLAALSSAIGDIQDRQAEGGSQKAVRTRFRIAHDGREFSVVADRRQLLEFLLAAFESAIRMRCESERVSDECTVELKSISGRLSALAAERDGTVANLHKELEERNKTIVNVQAALAAQEQAEALLQTRFDNVARELKDLGAVLEETRKSDEEKSRRIATLESDSAAAAVEWKETRKDLTGRVNNLTEQLEKTTLERDSARSTVAALEVKIAELERQLNTTRDGLEQNAMQVRSLTSDLEKMTRERDAVSLRADGLEQQLATVMNDLEKSTVAAKSLKNDLDKAVRERDDGNRRAGELERQLAMTRNDLEKSIADVRSLKSDLGKATSERDALTKRTGELEKNLDETQATARSREQEVRTALDNVTGDLQSIQNALEQNLRQLEQQLAARKELEQQVDALTRERDTLTGTCNSLQERCTKLQEDLQAAVTESRAREKEVRTALDNVTGDLHSIQNALEQNLRQLEQQLAVRNELEKQVENLTRERDALSRDHGKAKTGIEELQGLLAAEKDSRIQAENNGNSLRSGYDEAKGRLQEALQEVDRLTAENRKLAEEKQKGQHAAFEIERLQATLGNLTSRLTNAENTLATEQEKTARSESEIQALTERYENARKFLDSTSRDIGVLNGALEEERGKKRALEEQLSAAGRECAEKERAIKALRDELEAARSELSQVEVPVEDRTHEDLQTAPEQPVPEVPRPEATPSAPVPPIAESSPASVPVTIPAEISPVSPSVTEAGKPAVSPEPVSETSASDNQDEIISVPGAKPSTESGSPAPFSHALGSPNVTISRDRWMDIIKWAHHTDALAPEDRKTMIGDLMRLSKLVQKGRHLTNRQDQEIRALVARVQSLGYRFV